MPKQTLYLIRHAKTPGNLERRYIGRTDEPIDPSEAGRVLSDAIPAVQRVYISPMLRCVQTAALLYPGCAPVLVDGLRECDFGVFERKTFEELKDAPDYRAWISGGSAAPPGGEARTAFAARCCAAFDMTVRECIRDGIESAAFVIHGGTIMAIMEQYAGSRTPKTFYDWQVENLCGWAVETTLFKWVETMTLLGATKLVVFQD